MKKIIYLLVLPVLVMSCLAFARFKSVVETERYSVIQGVEVLLGEKSDVKVVIDGKDYDRNVLYDISQECIKSVIIKPIYLTKSISGKSLSDKTAKIVDGRFAAALVDIKTKNGKVAYMTDIERENLVKERTASNITEFYSRVHLKFDDGKPYDKAIVHPLQGSNSITIKLGDKIGFLIDSVFYNENDIRFINPDKMKEIMVTGEILASYTKPDEYAKGYAAVFNIKTTKLKVAGDSTNIKPKVEVMKATQPTVNPKSAVIEQNSTPEDKALVAKEQNALSEKLMHDAEAPFFGRYHFAPAGSKRFDIAMFKLNANTVVGSTLGVNDNVGIWIDGKFYNEDAIKKLTPQKIATLVIDDNPDYSKLEKVANGAHNSLPIKLKTKTDQNGATDNTAKTDDRSLTPGENQLIQKTLAMPGALFFNRFHFDRPKSKGFDVIAFKLEEMSMTAILDVNGKSGAFIDNRFYNEDALKKISHDRAATLEIDNRPDYFNREKIPDDANYAVAFSFKTKVTSGSTVKPNNSNDEVVKVKQTEKSTQFNRVDSVTAHNNMIAQEALNRSSYPQFYKRVKFNAIDGKNYDVVMCTIEKGIVSTEVKLNANVGLLIDGVFYNEDAIKKLPASKTKALEMWREGLDASKVPTGYLAAFSLRTKKT